MTLALFAGVALSLAPPTLAAPAAAPSATGAMPVQPLSVCPFRAGIECPPRLVFELGGVISPKRLPKLERAPVALEVRGKVADSRGGHPPALRKAVLDIDKHGAVDAGGLPACALRRLERLGTEAARRLCRAAIVGRGVARIGAGPEAGSYRIPLTAFNGGVKRGVTRLFVHGAAPELAPLPVVAVAKISKLRKQGRYGLRATWRIPHILEGSGSVLDFRLKVERAFTHEGERRSYLRARCVDGRLRSQLEAYFRDEARSGARTKMRGRPISPCIPTGS